MHRFHCRQTPLSGTGAAGAHGAQRGSVRVGQTPGIHSHLFGATLAQGFLPRQPQSAVARAGDKGVGSMSHVTRPLAAWGEQR